MKYVKECLIIFGITLAGEVLNGILPLPVPAGVEATGNFLLDTMPIMFIPACVGLMESYADMKENLIPLFVISLASTVIVMVVTGMVAERILSGKKTGEEKGGEKK